MTRDEFTTATTMILDRWPFKGAEYRQDYVSRLWEGVRHIDARLFQKTVARLTADVGALRPSPQALTRMVRPGPKMDLGILREHGGRIGRKVADQLERESCG